jgi:hypothetical protein
MEGKWPTVSAGNAAALIRKQSLNILKEIIPLPRIEFQKHSSWSISRLVKIQTEVDFLYDSSVKKTGA